MNILEIQLASVIVHLAEYIESGHQIDLEAAKGVLKNPYVSSQLRELRASAMLPHPRSELTLLSCIDEE